MLALAQRGCLGLPILLHVALLLFAQPQGFEPAHSQHFFKIGCPDCLFTVFLSGVARASRRQAPDARLLADPLGPGCDFEQALADGERDVVIGNWPEPPESLHIAPLLEDEIVCLMPASHPLARAPMSRGQYLPRRTRCRCPARTRTGA